MSVAPDDGTARLAPDRLADAVADLAEAIRALTAAFNAAAPADERGTARTPGSATALHTAIRATPNHRDRKDRSIGFGPVDA